MNFCEILSHLVDGGKKNTTYGKVQGEVKNHTLLVKARLSFGEKWREKELDIFTRKYIRGLLKD